MCRYLRKLMEDAGLEVTVDAVGNTFGRWEGADPSASALISHSAAILLKIYIPPIKELSQRRC